MPKKPPNLFNFWNELKRRKVVKTLFVYVAVAWAILEAADTIFPRLGLPEWTVTFVLILLVIVFILVIVLTWVYDITPEGIKVTRDLEEKLKEETERTTARDKDLQDIIIKPEADRDESDLQLKVQALEEQLKEARRASLRSAWPIVFKKIGIPVLIAALLLILVFNKQRIVEIMGFGDAPKELALSHVKSATENFDNGNYDAAKAELELALESDPKCSPAWSSLAAISVKQGDFDTAVRQTLEALNCDRNNYMAAYNLAWAFEEKNQYDRALEWYANAIKADSTFVQAYSTLGRLYNLMNKPDQAFLVLSLAKDKYPESEYMYLIYKNLGNSNLLMNQIDEAVRNLEHSREINPSEPETNLFLARAYESAGQINKSIEQWQNYIDLETDTAKINDAVRHRKELAVRQLQEIIK